MSTEAQFDDLNTNQWVTYLRSMFGQMRDPDQTERFRQQLAAIPAFVAALPFIEEAALRQDQIDAAVRVTCKRVRRSLVRDQEQRNVAVLQQNSDFGSF